MEIWTFDYNPATGKPEPIATTCEAFGYPYRDAEGRQMFENTHFRTKDKAWRGLRANALANLKHWANERKQLRLRLQEASEHLAAAAEFSVEVEAAHEREQKDAP